jgi:two-component system NtrC family sensor kinase
VVHVLGQCQIRLADYLSAAATLDTARQLDPDLPEIRGNKGKLQQVALNLLLNARDAVGDQGEIFVTTFSRAGRICFEVRDNGVGIPEEDQSRIFDPFFSTKGRGMGTGLGLSISYGIVREHQGRIDTESVPGEQTRFRVELPAKDRARAMA